MPAWLGAARTMRSSLLLLLVVLPLLAGTATAQSGAVILTPRGEQQAILAYGDEPQAFTYTLRNVHPSNPAFVQITATAPRGWEVSLPSSEILLAPDAAGTNANTTEIRVWATSREYVRGPVILSFEFTSADARFRETRIIEVVPAEPYVLGQFANPLPAPLNDSYGVFLLNLASFVLVGAVVILVQEPLVRVLSRRTNRPLVDLAIRKLRTPVIVLAGFLGLEYSIEVLPPSSFVDAVIRLLDLGIYLVALYLAYKVFDSMLTFYALKVASKTETKVDDVLIPLVRKIAVVVFIIAGIIFTVRALEVDLTVFVAGGVVASMVLAFAAQETLSNFFSGIHLMVDRPFVEGDLIQLESGEVCRVEHVGLRSTRLYHTRRHEIIVLPNNKLSSSRVTNLLGPDPKYRLDIDLGVAYRSDPALVKKILLDAARAHPGIVQNDEQGPQVFLTNFGDNALLFTLRVTLVSIWDRWSVPSDIREQVLATFRREGIEIPFPQRDLWIRGGDGVTALAAAPSRDVAVKPAAGERR